MMSNQIIEHKRSVPYIRQLEKSECGLTCLAMVLSYYHHEVELFRLRNHISGGRNGISLLTLKKLAISFNLDSQGKKGSVDVLHSIPHPVICYWDNSHYVVLEKISDKFFFIVDPSLGKMKLTLEEFRSKYSGYFLTMKPTEKFIKKKKEKNILWSYLKPFLYERKILATIILFAFLLQLISICIPMLSKYVVDKASISKQLNIVHIVGVAMISAVILQITFRYIHGYMLIILQNKLDKKLIERFISHLFSLPLRFFQVRSNGDLVMRSHNIEILRELIVNHLVSTIINVFVLAFMFVYMLSQSISLSLGLLAIGIFQVMFTLITRDKMKNLSTQEIASTAALRSYLTESIQGISLIKNVGIEEHIIHKWSNLFDKKLENAYQKNKVNLSIESVLQSIQLLVPALIIWIGTYQLIQGQISIGTLFAFQSLSISFLTPINSLASSITALTQMETILDLIMDVERTKKEDTSGKSFENLKGNITLNNVSFQFDAHSPLALKNINLEIPHGKKVAIIGESGSGKSTLISLLNGLFEPTQGTIYYDKYNMADLDKKLLRSQLGIVTQNHILFNQTIRENISLGNPDLDYSDIIISAQLAEIHDDIMKMPMQYETIISENGTNLSGGQKQRLSIARALINQPKILILDEATSALDTVTEEKVDANISSMNCTRIVVAHRLSTIINSDMVVILKDGQIVANGTHKQLEKNPEYLKFFKKQQRDEFDTEQIKHLQKVSN